jgi:hypothetical protein
MKPWDAKNLQKSAVLYIKCKVFAYNPGTSSHTLKHLKVTSDTNMMWTGNVTQAVERLLCKREAPQFKS